LTFERRKIAETGRSKAVQTREKHMKILKALMITSAAIAVTPASAATFTWSGGSYIPGVTSPNPLMSPDIFEITTSASKFFNAATFTNQSGTVNWRGGFIGFLSGSTVTNNALWDMSADNSMGFSGGAASSFTNNGILRKSGGIGISTISNTATLAIVNNGTIDAQTGSINFNGSNSTFNAGSVFTGAGEVNITANATFNGGFTSSNVDFESGTFTGNAAVLTGSADWSGGTLSGGWTINSGATLAVTGAASKFTNGANIVNNGTTAWQGGFVGFLNGTQFTNEGAITATSDNAFGFSGGTASTFTNNGLFQKTAGAGVTTLSNTSTLAIVNNGTINVLSGTIALPGTFANDGTLGGTGTFTSTNLTNNGTIAPGAPGATGTLSLTGNYSQSAAGAFNVQLASSGAFDLFKISGTAGLNGTLNLSCILGCAISTGDSFVILDSIGNLSGTFSNVTTSGFLNGFAYDIVYDQTADLVRLNILNAGMAPMGGVPEPATWAMLITGFGFVGGAMRRRKGMQTRFA
jgi:hypothetical protein